MAGEGGQGDQGDGDQDHDVGSAVEGDHGEFHGIDGEGVLRFLNHSCSPNVEFDGPELYAIQAHYVRAHHLPSPQEAEAMAELHRELQGLRALVHRLADLLLRERLISNEDLSAAVESADRESDARQPGGGDDVIKSPG